MSAVRGGLTLLGGSGVGFLLRFARNVLVARLISVEDYGIASTFMVAVAFVDMATNLGLGHLMVQSRSGDDPRFVAALKSITVLRGVLVSLILLAAAGPLAAMFGQPQLVWAYQVVAALPLIGAFMHPDLVRLQRQMRFGVLMLNRIGTLGVTLALAWPLALLLGDFRVMLALYLIEAVCRLALSFAIAERPFRLAWDGKIVREAIRFAWPLTLSGLLTFAAMQGDRIIVANRFGAELLGLFSAAMTLTMPAALQSAELARTFFVPLLARRQDDREAFARLSAFAIQSTLCAAAAAILGYGLLGPPVLKLVFGERYAEASAYVGLLGIVFGLQLARSGTTTVALALGHTFNMLVANAFRLAFLPVAFLVAFRGGSIQDVIAIGALGQLSGIAASLLMLKIRSGVGGLDRVVLPAALGAGCALAMGIGLHAGEGGRVPPEAAVPAVLLFAAMLASCRTMWRELLRILPRRG